MNHATYYKNCTGSDYGTNFPYSIVSVCITLLSSLSTDNRAIYGRFLNPVPMCMHPDYVTFVIYNFTPAFWPRFHCFKCKRCFIQTSLT